MGYDEERDFELAELRKISKATVDFLYWINDNWPDSGFDWGFREQVKKLERAVVFVPELKGEGYG